MTPQPNRHFGTVSWDWLRGLARDRSLTQAAFAFALSRVAVLAIFIVTGAATYDVKAPGHKPDDPHPTATVRSAEIKNDLRTIIGRNNDTIYSFD